MNKVLIFEAAAADPAQDRVVRQSANGQMTIVAIAAPEQGAAVARELVDAGAELIELCGGFSPAWRIKVMEAIGGRAMVSSVTYGIESLEAGARYKQAFERGEALKEAFILLEPGAAGAADRVVIDAERVPTLLVPVPDDEAAARAAVALVDEGVQLIELYGGLSTNGISLVLEAVAGRAAVGTNSFALDAALNPTTGGHE